MQEGLEVGEVILGEEGDKTVVATAPKPEEREEAHRLPTQPAIK
jgi:hypothetical protein